MATHFDRMEAVYSLGLPRSQKDLLLYLLHRASFKTWKCSPSIATIAKDTGLHRQSVLAARQSLRNAGFLTWTRRVINSTRNDTTEYKVERKSLVEISTKGVGRKGNQRTNYIQPRRSRLPEPTPGNVVKLFPEYQNAKP